MRALISALCFGFGLQTVGAAAQTLANAQFNIRFSSAGIAGIKHTHDAYDTDYIASRRDLGNVTIRYRRPNEAAWQQTQSAHNPQAAGQRVSYTIGRAVPTLATMSRARSSADIRGISALTFLVENRAPDNEGHDTILHLRGLPAGVYNVTVAGKTVQRIVNRGGELNDLVLPVRSAISRITITRNQGEITP